MHAWIDNMINHDFWWAFNDVLHPTPLGIEIYNEVTDDGAILDMSGGLA